ncbi:uncharacterized protein LOC128342544 isoform X2 [Hemicordylus capensis]|uniref:uncharacterized protein LOC128342544 isoform X2 n=1 Tax=Hemicordylus capensis TaxID=884348 RepID=UPI0023034D1B|nr:uncharacterized protein LOC128342544 isoform X2 [Hemicordylus capensis]XP_053145921.1 uncharacterized protein LOC128342544 isoform X2 [Hemicordylus capensis]
MRGLVKRKLKGKVRRVKSLHKASNLFKTTIIEAQLECLPRRRKGTTKFRKMPAWLIRRVSKAIKVKKTCFRKWESCPNKENRKEHKLWQKKCNETIRDAKREFEEHIDTSVKGNKKNFFKYIRRRKPAREAVGPLDEGIKGSIKEDKEIAEKLNEFFAFVFMAEDTDHIPTLELSFSGLEAEELDQFEVTLKTDEIDSSYLPLGNLQEKMEEGCLHYYSMAWTSFILNFNFKNCREYLYLLSSSVSERIPRKEVAESSAIQTKFTIQCVCVRWMPYPLSSVPGLWAQRMKQLDLILEFGSSFSTSRIKNSKGIKDKRTQQEQICILSNFKYGKEK